MIEKQLEYWLKHFVKIMTKNITGYETIEYVILFAYYNFCFTFLSQSQAANMEFYQSYKCGTGSTRLQT